MVVNMKSSLERAMKQIMNSVIVSFMWGHGLGCHKSDCDDNTTTTTMVTKSAWPDCLLPIIMIINIATMITVVILVMIVGARV